MTDPVTWDWQEPYNSALREKDTGNLAERLVTAEKAILHRMQELRDPVDELPEGRALREALDCLYALCPREHYPPGQLHVGPDMTRRNWGRLAAWVVLAASLSFATGWIVATRNTRNEVQETGSLVNSRRVIIAERGDRSAFDAGPNEYGLKTRPAESTLDRSHSTPDRRVSTPYSSLIDKSNAGRQNENISNLPGAPVAAPDALVAKGPDNPVENAASQEDSAASTSTKPASNPAEEDQTAASPATEAQEKPQVPRGSVSVSSSTYPSIRVPPELKSEASSSGASLQIGESISRVDPIYPEQAERQGVEGTVRLRAIIGKDGAVQDVEVLSGPALLVSAGVSAIRQWRYQPTLLGDQPIEVAEDITIVFRLAR